MYVRLRPGLVSGRFVGIVLIAAILAPSVAEAVKPAVKAVGKGLRHLGDILVGEEKETATAVCEAPTVPEDSVEQAAEQVEATVVEDEAEPKAKSRSQKDSSGTV